jgi:truncated hemoglobin YjbI
VHELNKIQEKYSDIGVKKSPWFNAQLKESINNQQYDRLVQYVGEIWKYITKDNAPDFSKIQAVNNATGLASKAMAGEFGMSIAGIKSDAVQRRVITHLYEACASIAFGSGLNKDELELLQATGGSGVSRRSKFNSSIHVKVY